MDSTNIDYQLLARYMSGETTAREDAEISEWAGENERNAQMLEEFERIWDTSGREMRNFYRRRNARESWDKLKQRIEKEQEKEKLSSGTTRKVSPVSSLHSTTYRILRIAAVFLVAGLIGFSTYLVYTPQAEEQEPVLREISTAEAQRVNMTLGDGTAVMLNADSKIRFPNQFKPDLREVFLEGEAYFKVDHNPGRPFVIHSSGSLIRVLGTSFSIRSYTEDGQVQVVVEEGSVSFEVDNERITEKTTLEANQVGRYYFRDNVIETSEVDDMQLYMSWKEGYLKFRNLPMEKVAVELKRHYGVEITFEDDEIKKMLLTAFLKSRSLRNVLDVIAMSLDIDYRLQEDNVHFVKQQ